MRQRRLHDDLLQGLARGIHRLGAKAAEAKPAPECALRVVVFAAPGAGGVVASGVAQAAHQRHGLRKLAAHPGRHDGMAARHRQPGQRIGQRPGGAPCIACDLGRRRLATARRQKAPQGGHRLRLGGHELPACGGEQAVQARRRGAFGRQQAVPRQHQIRLAVVQALKLLVLIGEQRQRELGVAHRVVAPVGVQAPVLVMLDEVVIRVARKGQRIELQRVHHGQRQQRQARVGGGQVRAVEGGDVVPQHELGALRERVQFAQDRRQLVHAAAEGRARFAAHRAHLLDAAAGRVDFKVDAHAARRQPARRRGLGVGFGVGVGVRLRRPRVFRFGHHLRMMPHGFVVACAPAPGALTARPAPRARRPPGGARR